MALYTIEHRTLREKNMSYNTGSLPYKSQGGDFVLEGKVQWQKLITPKAAVKGETWKMLARCMDEFDDICDMLCDYSTNGCHVTKM